MRRKWRADYNRCGFVGEGLCWRRLSRSLRGRLQIQKMDFRKHELNYKLYYFSEKLFHTVYKTLKLLFESKILTCKLYATIYRQSSSISTKLYQRTRCLKGVSINVFSPVYILVYSLILNEFSMSVRIIISSVRYFVSGRLFDLLIPRQIWTEYFFA